MRKATITFEVTETKTEVTVIGVDGITDKSDITGTKVEKSFISLLKKLRQHQAEVLIIDSIDINTWEEK